MVGSELQEGVVALTTQHSPFTTHQANARVTYLSLLRTSPNGRFSGLPLGRSQRRMYGFSSLEATTLGWTPSNAE